MGGVSGYEEFVEAIFDPAHEDYEQFVRWAGDHFHDEFDLKAVNETLSRMQWPVRNATVKVEDGRDWVKGRARSPSGMVLKERLKEMLSALPTS